MKFQLIVLLALVALSRSVPENAVVVLENVEEKVGIAEKKEIDEPAADLQNDDYYNYGYSKWSGMASWYPRSAYEKMASDLKRCQRDLVTANSNLLLEVPYVPPRPVYKCNLKRDPGSCTAYQTRYYYNASYRRCESFTYGGCGGNSNNFVSKRECEVQCDHPKRPFCYNNADRGNCEKSLLRYYYNSRTNRCESFWYTGCGGNQNNFVSRERCEIFC